ncbi:MAG: hypothetical protein DMF93_17330 [Acidobacteria bacterium]|nr:MAG: hypothetical protein DMF93_17330 [Acidobacteriota bacterium]
MEEPRFDPLDYVSVFNRRKWWFIVPVALSLVVGGFLVWLLPRTYQATTTVAVSASRVAPNVIGAVEIDKQERMRAVSQQLLSRSVLERTARLEHLDEHGSIEAAVSRLRSGISVALPDSITPGAAPTGAPGAQLSPEQKAQLDTYQLSFVQLRASEARLNGLEARLREMKETFMGRLPEQTNANLAMVSAMQRQLESNATTTRGEQDRLSMVEKQIDSMQLNADEAVSAMKGTPAETAQSRVVALRRELADAQLTFTDKHPEVIRLKEELSTAEKAAAAERARPVSDRMAILNANAEYRQLLKEREAGKLRVADLHRQTQVITAQIAQYSGRVEAAPRVEQQLVSLQRAYDLERGAYQDLSQKKQAALLNEELQRKQGGEQFAVLVPAGLPTEPFKPKPLRVMLMAIAAGLVLGGAFAFGREYLDRSVHDARGLRDEFELPVLAEIPRIEPVLG